MAFSELAFWAGLSITIARPDGLDGNIEGLILTDHAIGPKQSGTKIGISIFLIKALEGGKQN